MEWWNGMLEWNIGMSNLKVVGFNRGIKRMLKKQFSLCCEVEMAFFKHAINKPFIATDFFVCLSFSYIYRPQLSEIENSH